ncbi:hypothetical protein M0R45_006568 [Rubus argutus]|uniref:Uncharacterized protein n=1 Tax=Rubus argutus TaxID=59490 RepID=A0AAW1YQW6_RUBAR
MSRDVANRARSREGGNYGRSKERRPRWRQQQGEHGDDGRTDDVWTEHGKGNDDGEASGKQHGLGEADGGWARCRRMCRRDWLGQQRRALVATTRGCDARSRGGSYGVGRAGRHGKWLRTDR